MQRLCAALLALLVCATIAEAGPEWVEDDLGGGDAGNDRPGAQITRGTGSLSTIGGQLGGLTSGSPVGFGDIPSIDDFEDVYVINIINANAFTASIASFFGGDADFDARLFLFDENGIGVLANDDTFFVGVTQGTSGDDDDDDDDDDKGKDPPQISSGPTLLNQSTDGSNVQVTEGRYLLAVSYSPNQPLGGGSPGSRGKGGSPIFNFENPFEISGADGPGGAFELSGWTRPPVPGDVTGLDRTGPPVTGNYLITLRGVGFAEPLQPPGTGGGPADRGTATEKGTVLVYSKVEIRWDANGNLIQDTFLTLTNDYPQNVRVQLYYINGDAPLAANPAAGERAHPGWNWAGIEIWLTSDQPTYWSAATGLGGNGPDDPTFSPWTVLDPGAPPGRPANDGTAERVLRGYIIAWPVNEQDHELRWNHLAGDATLVNYREGSAWTYLTWAFQSVNAAVAHGTPTGTPGILNFDGVEFTRPYGELLMNFQAVGSTAYNGPKMVTTTDVDLTLHPLTADLRQETTGPVTTKADFVTWNQNEVKLSGQHRCITCWDQQLLSLYEFPNHFKIAALQTTHGKSRIDGISSQNCDLDLFGLGGPGTPPDGVIDFVSEATALLGVRAMHLRFDTAFGFDRTGGNLFGMGVETAVVRIDTVNIPPELWDDGLLTPEEIAEWKEREGKKPKPAAETVKQVTKPKRRPGKNGGDSPRK